MSEKFTLDHDIEEFEKNLNELSESFLKVKNDFFSSILKEPEMIDHSPYRKILEFVVLGFVFGKKVSDFNSER
jgi:hypothetical protein